MPPTLLHCNLTIRARTMRWCSGQPHFAGFISRRIGTGSGMGSVRACGSGKGVGRSTAASSTCRALVDTQKGCARVMGYLDSPLESLANRVWCLIPLKKKIEVLGVVTRHAESSK